MRCAAAFWILCSCLVSEAGSPVQVGDDQCLDQELRCVFCKERPDHVDLVEGKSAGSGYSRDVGGAGQSIAEDDGRVLFSLLG